MTKKKKSKRISLHQKYKVQKKVQQHHAKQRRERRKNPHLHRKST